MSEHIPLRVRVKFFLKRLLPSFIFAYVTTLWIKTGARLVGDQTVVDRHLELFLARFPREVQAGPFTGMQYVDSSVGSAYFHKLVGSYEAILHPYIRSLTGRKFDTILDIGSAEGYYLVGLGRMFTDATLIGFEIEEKGRTLSKELYDKNGLNNTLILNGEATRDNVAPLITPKTLLICDCEGAEIDILDPESRSEFSEIDTAIIELHDFLRPGIKQALTERFSRTHAITIIPFSMANPNDFPYLASVENKQDLYNLRRERGWQEQEWMILEKKAVQERATV